MLCAKFIPINTSLLLVDCTLSTSCEKWEVITTSRQNTLLKPPNFIPSKTHRTVWTWYSGSHRARGTYP